MSGGGGSGSGLSRVDGPSGGGGAGAGADRGVLPCESLRFPTYLHGVQAEVAEVVQLADILPVHYRTDPRRIAVETGDGALLGAVLEQIERLVECMQQGVEYEAEIIGLDDGVVVEIRPA